MSKHMASRQLGVLWVCTQNRIQSVSSIRHSFSSIWGSSWPPKRNTNQQKLPFGAPPNESPLTTFKDYKYVLSALQSHPDRLLGVFVADATVAEPEKWMEDLRKSHRNWVPRRPKSGLEMWEMWWTNDGFCRFLWSFQRLQMIEQTSVVLGFDDRFLDPFWRWCDDKRWEMLRGYQFGHLLNHNPTTAGS